MKYCETTIYKTGKNFGQDLDPSYTRAKVFGFITKLERFSTGFVLPFTHAATNPIVNLLRSVPSPKTLNPETLVARNFVVRIRKHLSPEKTLVETVFRTESE